MNYSEADLLFFVKLNASHELNLLILWPATVVDATCSVWNLPLLWFVDQRWSLHHHGAQGLAPLPYSAVCMSAQCQIWTAAAIVNVENPLCLQQLWPRVTPRKYCWLKACCSDITHSGMEMMRQIALFIVLSARCGPRCRERRHPETHASPLCFKSFNYHNQACISRHLATYQPWAEWDGAKKE